MPPKPKVTRYAIYTKQTQNGYVDFTSQEIPLRLELVRRRDKTPQMYDALVYYLRPVKTEGGDS